MPTDALSDLRLLILGANGQLGQALTGLPPDSVGAVRADIDLSRTEYLAEAFKAFLDQHEPFDAVINAAAYTAVDNAETDVETAQAVNSVAPGLLAQVCKSAELPFIHISTDYVFDGSSTQPYRETAPTNPVNVYGATKLQGEATILEVQLELFAILRTSWVYDASNRNFLTTMLRLGREQDELRIVDDQVGRPTYTYDLAEAVLATAKAIIADKRLSGLYHVTNTGELVSWAGFAQEILRLEGIKTPIRPIPTTDYPTPARRPAFSALNTSHFEKTFQHSLPDWRDGLKRALSKPS